MSERIFQIKDSGMRDDSHRKALWLKSFLSFTPFHRFSWRRSCEMGSATAGEGPEGPTQDPWRINMAPWKGNTLRGINISHLGKRKIIFKMPFLGDMLVSWRVSQKGFSTPNHSFSAPFAFSFTGLHLPRATTFWMFDITFCCRKSTKPL